MRMEEIVEGEVYWSINPSDETISYDQNLSPTMPHRVKAMIYSYLGSLTKYVVIYCFNKETGEIDEDSNARFTFSGAERDGGIFWVFKTFEEAKEAYILSVRHFAENLRSEADSWEKDLKKIDWGKYE